MIAVLSSLATTRTIPRLGLLVPSTFAAPTTQAIPRLGFLIPSTIAAPVLTPDSVQIQGGTPASPAKPHKTAGQALLSAAKWGAVGGVLSAVPLVGYFVSALGGAVAADLIAGKGKHKATAMLLGGTAGVATHVIPMAGVLVGSFALLPATVLFGAATWGYAAYQHARGNA